METLTSVLVVGPTGRFGIDICHNLSLQKDKFKRIAAFENTSRPSDAKKQQVYASFQDAGLEIVRGDYATIESFAGFDVVILALGNHAMIYQPQIIDTAIKAGVRHFYPSEFGADLTVGDNWYQRYYRDKVLTREHLQKRAADTEGLGWTYITVGRFAEWSVSPAFGVNNITHKAEIYGTPEGRQSLLAVENVATYLVCTLLDPFNPSQAESRQRTYRFHGGPYTWPQILDALEKVTGFKYDIKYISVELAAEREKKAKETGDVELELEASHELVQGREGTLLPLPKDNDKFPWVKIKSLEEALKGGFENPEVRKVLGL